MRIVTVKEKCGAVIPIGRLGENEATAVVFDVAEYEALFGAGTFSLLHQRSGDAAPYPCSIEHDGDTVTWTVTSADLGVQGYGKAELVYTVGGTVAKSVIYTTVTGAALTGGAEPPEPGEDWFERVLEAGAAAQEARQQWENMRAEAETLQPGTPATASYESGVLTLGIPQGAPGQDGADGITPTIGANGNWYLGSTDTGKPSRGIQGEQGIQGIQGVPGADGADGIDGADGADGKSAYESAQDGGYTGTEAQFNSDLAEVGGKYAKPSDGIPKTDLDASVQESLDSADSALQEVPIASGDTLGGVKVGSDFDIGDDGTLSLYNALTLSASVSPASAEMGSTIDDVTVSWTVNKTPVSQSVEGVDVPVSDRSKALHDLGITANRTFSVTAADARMSLTRNPSITFYRYVYSKVGSSDAAPTQASECVKQTDLSAFGNNGADFNYTSGSTLWLLTTKANAQIETNVLGQWADVTTINAGTVEFTQANGAVVTYYAYNTGVFTGTGSAKYRIR